MLSKKLFPPTHSREGLQLLLLQVYSGQSHFVPQLSKHCCRFCPYSMLSSLSCCYDSGRVAVGTALLSVIPQIPSGTKGPVGCLLPTDTSGKPKGKRFALLQPHVTFSALLEPAAQVAHFSCGVQNLPKRSLCLLRRVSVKFFCRRRGSSTPATSCT